MLAKQIHIASNANEEVSFGGQNRIPEIVADKARIPAKERVFREFFLLQYFHHVPPFARIRRAQSPSPADDGEISPLHRAIAADQEDVVEELLQRGADVEAVTGNGQLDVVHEQGGHGGPRPGLTPLHLAVSANRIRLVELLLNAGCNVDARTKPGLMRFTKSDLSHLTGKRSDWTALHMAAYGGQVTAGKLLLAAGADANAENDRGETPLHLAAGMNLGDSPWEDYPKMVQLLAEHGADIEMKMKGTGGTPLQCAAWFGPSPKCRALIDLGAEIDVFSACGLGMTERVAELLKADPSLANARLSGGNTQPVLWAAANGNTEIVDLLLKADANIDDNGARHGTALHEAALNGHFDVVELLIDRKADLNLSDHCGATALHQAAASGDERIVSLLLENGADPTVRNKAGKTALDIAERYEIEEIAKLLQQHSRN